MICNNQKQSYLVGQIWDFFSSLAYLVLTELEKKKHRISIIIIISIIIRQYVFISFFHHMSFAHLYFFINRYLAVLGKW